ncbi:RicAFT regulatory complex protein RicA family protein [Pullulanibacillus sp. KACC 23026]|uniref:RicAFT regulatory complex protein RicA family protein n=1 Tax=Pullulanibacillus sp. KACC 23026 TaxID=3028315 RepID=UPI0023B1FB0F|nr:RicAFT regulatory complex protein RicA family protein [Pullulanibacillus sp. KACC 23026]WEG11545.1 RicAFT regulatory complex protein RicA family protein [Pullulanibacillus sp. KACC 23026]
MTEKFSREAIIDKANELAKLLAETDEVDFFKRAEAQINENEKVQQLIRRIKLLQKESINLQHYGKEEALRQNEEKLNQLMKELDEIPIVQEFKQSQADVNDLLQFISITISNKVTDEILLSTGGDVLSNQTGSAIKAQAPGSTC